MVAAMAASLDAAYPGASSSTLCEVCQQEPHAVRLPASQKAGNR